MLLMCINVMWIVCGDVPQPLSKVFHFLYMRRCRNDAPLHNADLKKSELFGFKKKKEKMKKKASEPDLGLAF